MRGTIVYNKFVAYYETGHKKEEWEAKYGNDPDLWDFPADEILDGTILPCPAYLYWLIDGRFYETDIEA